MQARVEKLLATSVPLTDQSDVYRLEGAPRQFAPEYSQACFETMLRNEQATGSYLGAPALGFPSRARETMVQLIQEVHQARGYKEYTLHQSVVIADRFLAVLAARSEKAPLLSHLSLVSVLISAKLNEPLQPVFQNMVNLINSWQSDHVTVSDLVKLEERVVRTLDFDFNLVTPLHFLERFQRLFGLDQVEQDKHAYLIDASAIYLLRFMMRDSAFLEFRPSQIAAAAIMLAINANVESPLAKAMQVTLLPKDLFNVETLFHHETISIANGEGSAR